MTSESALNLGLHIARFHLGLQLDEVADALDTPETAQRCLGRILLVPIGDLALQGDPPSADEDLDVRHR